MSIQINTYRLWTIGLLTAFLVITAGCGQAAVSSQETKVGEGEAADEVSAPAAKEAPSLELKLMEAPAEEASAPAAGMTMPPPTPVPTTTYRGEVTEEVAPPAYIESAAEPLAAREMAPADEVVGVEVEFGAETRRTEMRAVEIPQAQPLRAGEVDDNAAWDDYLLYRRNYVGGAVHDRDVSERYIVAVKDGQGHPILGATVRIFLDGQESQEIYSGRTAANGQILFHPLTLDLPIDQADRFQVEVAKDGQQAQFTLARFEAQTGAGFTERWNVTLEPQAQFNTLNLDVLFLIDATGSMADEIGKIQSTIFDVAARIDALPGRPDVRYGMVTYRDRGDSFVSNTYEFTPDVGEFHRHLSTVYADGGGDYPESLNEGLYHALHSVEWRSGDTVQMIFLVADAPPHLDYAQDYDYADEMVVAARRGIKIFPIASSGLDDQGEYNFRQLAQYTQGRFIFLTYEGPTNGGAPGEITTHHVEDYSVDNLDNLLVKLVRDELAHQNPQMTQAQ